MLVCAVAAKNEQTWASPLMTTHVPIVSWLAPQRGPAELVQSSKVTDQIWGSSTKRVNDRGVGAPKVSIYFSKNKSD